MLLNAKSDGSVGFAGHSVNEVEDVALIWEHIFLRVLLQNEERVIYINVIPSPSILHPSFLISYSSSFIVKSSYIT